MLGQLLSSFTQSLAVDPLTHQLQKQNQIIDKQILQTDTILEHIPIQKITNYIQSRDQTFRPLSKQKDAETKLIILQRLYIVICRDQQSKIKCQQFIQQVNNISNLIQSFSIYEFLEVSHKQYSQQQAARIKILIIQLSQQIIAFSDGKSINKYKNQEEQISHQCKYSILFLKKLREVISSLHQQMVCSIYRITQDTVHINLSSYLPLWKQQYKFIANFLGSLEQFFSKFISYQVNDKQYYFKVYIFVVSNSSFGIKQQSHLVFQCSQVSLHYETIKQSLVQFGQFFDFLVKIPLSDNIHLISDLRKKISTKVKQYFQYLMPYLNMSCRKQLIDILFNQSEAFNLTIYQLLANIKLTGQDVGSLVDVIQQIARKLTQHPNSIATVFKFIDMAKVSRKNFNMLFFLSDQLIDEFESVQEVKLEVGEYIKQLLEIREQIRGKIHYGQNIDQL